MPFIPMCREHRKENNDEYFDGAEDSKYSALFTYDSMVHFEMMDVYEYLKDIYRVLQDGGKELTPFQLCRRLYG